MGLQLLFVLFNQIFFVVLVHYTKICLDTQKSDQRENAKQSFVLLRGGTTDPFLLSKRINLHMTKI